MSDPVAVDWTSFRCLCCHSVHCCCPLCCCPGYCCPHCCCLCCNLLGCNLLGCHFLSCQFPCRCFLLVIMSGWLIRIGIQMYPESGQCCLCCRCLRCCGLRWVRQSQVYIHMQCTPEGILYLTPWHMEIQWRRDLIHDRGQSCFLLSLTRCPMQKPLTLTAPFVGSQKSCLLCCLTTPTVILESMHVIFLQFFSSTAFHINSMKICRAY